MEVEKLPAARRGRKTVVCVAGTFDRLHIAHRALLRRACTAGDTVRVGIATDEMASKTRKGDRLQSYSVRARSVRQFLETLTDNFTVLPLDDRFGPAATGDYDAIVVSSDTRATAEHINAVRKRRGLRLLRISEVEMVPAEDGVPVSSTRVRRGETDVEGRLLRMIVTVGSANPVKVSAVDRIFRKAFRGRKLAIDGIPVDSGVPEEPFGEDVINGAINRAENALAESKAHFGVGVEAGLFLSKHTNDYFAVQFCAIVDRGGRITLGHGPGFQLPPVVISEIKRGKTVEEAMAAITGKRRIGRAEGAVGHLSKGLLVRKQLTETAVISALLPRINRELYLF